jgi:HTH-type transcriptional regulator/antitoxin HigA
MKGHGSVCTAKSEVGRLHCVVGHCRAPWQTLKGGPVTIASFAIDDRKYARLVSRARPVRITSEADYQRMLAEVERLMDKDEDTLSPEESTLLGLLATLIEHYEKEHYPIAQATPQEMLHHLMEARDLRAKDLWSLFGSKGVASEVLNGKRAISKGQAKKLAEFFHVSPALFI